jgi:hypothetical protein
VCGYKRLFGAQLALWSSPVSWELVAGMFALHASRIALRRRKRTNHLSLSFFPTEISHDFSPHEAALGVQDTGYVARRGQVVVRHVDELHRLRIVFVDTSKAPSRVGEPHEVYMGVVASLVHSVASSRAKHLRPWSRPSREAARARPATAGGSSRRCRSDYRKRAN